MLVLSRKTGERIHIGGGIELEVIAVQGSRVKLGISCPRDVPIVRAELTGAVANRVVDVGPSRRLHAAVG